MNPKQQDPTVTRSAAVSAESAASPGEPGSTTSAALAEKSVGAVIAAIEVYNKPNFSYREEAFALLMANAWELLLKAKWVVDHGEAIETLYETARDAAGVPGPKTNRSGNPFTYGCAYLAARLLEDKDSGLEESCHDNILALLEVRDNAAHFFNKDLYLGRRILEIGTASVRNYLVLATEWFQLDLSAYNFFLMPISFYHGFDTVEPAPTVRYPQQVRRLLAFLDSLEAKPEAEGSRQHFALRLETKLVRGKDASAVAFRWTDDPRAPTLTLREEDVLKNYPLTYRDLARAMRHRYEDFKENPQYHHLRKSIETERRYSIVRLLNPNNPNSSRQRFYNANVLQEFDRHYTRRRKS